MTMRSVLRSVVLAVAMAMGLGLGGGVSPRAEAGEPLTLTSIEQENKLGEEAYQDILKKEKINKDPIINAYVKRVAERLTKVAPDKGFKYEVTVLDSDKINAFCLPGGKICVYTGILPFCQNEAGLATVMGHEIAHAILRHGGQRMTQQTVVGAVGAGLGLLLDRSGLSDTTQSLARGAYGYGSQLGILLPYSRNHEFEADMAGLEYLSKAGYDPREAPEFWKRFAVLKSDTPSFLSTHPGSEDRALRLERALPGALKLYEASPKHNSGELVPEPYLTQKKPADPKPEDKPADQPKKKKKKKKEE